MDNCTLVTALYLHRPQEIIGGRGWSFPYFAAPFLNVLKLGQPIVIYTHDAMREPLENFLEQQATAEYKVIDYDLTKFKYSDEILHLKRSGGNFTNDTLNKGVSYISNDRNTHLCLNKIYWLNDEAILNRFNTEKYFWIDAGLFHHGIFPEKYGGRERLSKQENNDDLYYPKNKDSIFKPSLAEGLTRLADKFLSLRHSEMPTNEKMRQLLNVDGKILGYIVGGLFGGDEKHINLVAEDFDKALSILLDNNTFSLEENILSCITGWNPDLYQVVSFNNWHHDIAGEACHYGAGEDAKCFYKIFKDVFLNE
jgi:hypothetical protein